MQALKRSFCPTQFSLFIWLRDKQLRNVIISSMQGLAILPNFLGIYVQSNSFPTHDFIPETAQVKAKYRHPKMLYG